MWPTQNNEIVFEGALEARVAAHLLTNAGREDLLDSVEPPIQPSTIGRFEFMAGLAHEQRGRGDTTEYVCSQAATVDILKTLIYVVNLTPPDQKTLSRKKYMGQRIIEYTQKFRRLTAKTAETYTVEVGRLIFTGVDDKQKSLLQRREAFVNEFLAVRGWNADDLTIEQVMEIRKQPEWQDPPEIN